MPLFTSPPHFTSGAQWKLLRGKAAIFCWVLLDGKLRVLGGKIVFRRVYFPVGAHRAAGSTTCSGMYRRLPAVAFVASPPDLLLAAVRNLIRGQGQIALRIPLFQ